MFVWEKHKTLLSVFAASVQLSPRMYATSTPPAMMMLVVWSTMASLMPKPSSSGVTKPMIAAQNLRLVSFFFQSIFIQIRPFLEIKATIHF